MDDFFFEVNVMCMTYNQSDYILDTLNGFCKQKTSFPFICTIVDDASTDGEQDIIKKFMISNFDIENIKGAYEKETDYAHIIFARHLSNHNCFFAVFFLKYNHYQARKSKANYFKKWQKSVKYFAKCDGDDYWTDPLKLQKQYDLMESHPEFSLCHHNYMILKDNVLCDRNATIPLHQDLLSIAENNTVATPTMFYRNIGVSLVPSDFPFKYHLYQHFYNLRLAEYGDIVYIDEPMGVYRVNQGGIYSMKSQKQQFTMAMGNLENMIDWYTKGNNQPEVVEVLKKRAKHVGKIFINRAIKQLRIKDVFFMWKWIHRLS